jgi:hypothetical protein
MTRSVALVRTSMKRGGRGGGGEEGEGEEEIGTKGKRTWLRWRRL